MSKFTCSRCGETFEGEQRFIVGREVYCSLPCYTNTPSDLEKKPSKNDLGDLPEKSSKILDDDKYEENPLLVECIDDSGYDKEYLTTGKIYRVLIEYSDNTYSIVSDYGRISTFDKSRFKEAE